MTDVMKLANRLANHPDLQKRMEEILDIVDNKDGDCTRADDAEFRVIEEMRKLGKEVLQGWANKQQCLQENKLKDMAIPAERKGKKNSTGTQPTGP